MTVNNSDSFYFETSRGSFGKVNHARIKRGESVRFLVKVRNDKIQAYLNAALISEFVPATRALGPSGDWKLRDPRCLGLGNWNTTLVFTTIELTEVRGTGTRTHQ
jgi:hypothetical protein